MRGMVFARRVSRELMRDPLSYLFCLAMPVAMMALFFLVYQSMPAEAQANMEVFRMESMAPGVTYFGFSFVMLFATLTVSRDRAGAFLSRLFATPMRTADFLVGYALPLFLIGIGQWAVTMGVGALFGVIGDMPLSFVGCLRSLAALLPSLLMFLALGVMFGSLLSEVSAPGVTSLLITLSGVLGGVWMPLSQMGNFEKVCRVLPFYHGVRLARAALAGTGEFQWVSLAVCIAYTAGAVVCALVAFRRMMTRDDR